MKFLDRGSKTEYQGSLPVRGAWIEIRIVIFSGRIMMSLPVRGAWIEINRHARGNRLLRVAPRKGSVD